MNDDINGKLNDPKPEPLVARSRAHSLVSLYSVFGQTANFRNPGGAMQLRHYAYEMSYTDAIYTLGQKGYRTRLECEVESFEDGKTVAALLRNYMNTGEYWTAFITNSPRHSDENRGARIYRLVFVFLSQADAMMLKLLIPADVRSTFRLTNEGLVLS